MVARNSSLLQARSVYLCFSIALTRPTRVFPIVLATGRYLHRPVPSTTWFARAYAWFSRVDLTLLHVHLTRHRACCQKFAHQPPSTLSSVTAVAQWSFLLFFYFPCFVIFLYFSFWCCLFYFFWAFISMLWCGLILRRRLIPFGSLQCLIYNYHFIVIVVLPALNSNGVS